MLLGARRLFVDARLGPLPAVAARARRRRGRVRARSAWRSAALAREVRAASLLAFLLSLPLAFLALVPSGAVSAALYDVDPRDLVAVPVQGRAAGARRGASTARRRRCAARSRTWPALAVAFGALARVGAAPRRLSAAARPGPSPSAIPLTWRRWPSPRRACAGCAHRRRCAGSCARRELRAGDLVLPLFVDARRRAAASRSRRCRASSACRSRHAVEEAARGAPRSGSPR